MEQKIEPKTQRFCSITIARRFLKERMSLSLKKIHIASGNPLDASRLSGGISEMFNSWMPQDPKVEVVE